MSIIQIVFNRLIVNKIHSETTYWTKPGKLYMFLELIGMISLQIQQVYSKLRDA